MVVSPSESYTEFVTQSGARIQQGLMAALGPDSGPDAAAEALTYGWEHWDRVSAMDNPAGYLFVVGRRRGRELDRPLVFPLILRPDDGAPWVEPALPDALALLSERQRVATLLVHGGGWTYVEVADLLDVDRGTVKKHADRGLEKLRSAMEVNVDG